MYTIEQIEYKTIIEHLGTLPPSIIKEVLNNKNLPSDAYFIMSTFAKNFAVQCIEQNYLNCGNKSNVKYEFYPYKDFSIAPRMENLLRKCEIDCYCSIKFPTVNINSVYGSFAKIQGHPEVDFVVYIKKNPSDFHPKDFDLERLSRYKFYSI